ncbi:Nif3-like dinuclear metal center hexameric protein [Aminipila terrae]|uniref:GTP cyclohydrolase 1 type 2 homolog n=1 Tax=Aminipila terrae TaxID=2697030 RepID=A0A6P1MHX2_9FIRM|nr:Nif3-like dinuclear metal center hexameric protein [Aminipila terrae]QHI73662.1 Nif3-like dinuclear metal center hexameric protein [Aminipila terrae]
MSTLEKIAPAELAESWDNSGFQINLEKGMINKILVTLEITGEVIKEAANLGVDMIITHHPLYFSPFKVVDRNTIIGNYTLELIKNGISVYSAHTNFDKAEYGNNFYLARLLNLKNINNFEKYSSDYTGLFGELPEKKSLKEIVREMEKLLDLHPNELRVVGNPEEQIRKIGLCTGAGIDMLEIAELNGCQLFITGDVKYHDAMKAKEKGMNVLDAGHYGTEKIFVSNMAGQLKNELKDAVEIFQSQVDINPFDFL